MHPAALRDKRPFFLFPSSSSREGLREGTCRVSAHLRCTPELSPLPSRYPTSSWAPVPKTSTSKSLGKSNCPFGCWKTERVCRGGCQTHPLTRYATCRQRP